MSGTQARRRHGLHSMALPHITQELRISCVRLLALAARPPQRFSTALCVAVLPLRVSMFLSVGFSVSCTALTGGAWPSCLRCLWGFGAVSGPSPCWLRTACSLPNTHAYARRASYRRRQSASESGYRGQTSEGRPGPTQWSTLGASITVSDCVALLTIPSCASMSLIGVLCLHARCAYIPVARACASVTRYRVACASYAVDVYRRSVYFRALPRMCSAKFPL